MKITTLGTSHGNATYCRFNSSTHFELSDTSLLIDAGAPVDALMIRKGLQINALDAVLITHMDGDHSGGLPNLIKMLLKYPRESGTTRIYLPDQGVAGKLSGWLHAMRIRWPSDKIELVEISEGIVHETDAVTVRAIGTRHIPMIGDRYRSFSFLIESEDKKVLHTGDLKSDFSDFPGIASETRISLCICELTHYKPELAKPTLREARLDRLVFNHIHDPWHGEGEQKIKEILADLPYPLAIAHDGDEFVV